MPSKTKNKNIELLINTIVIFAGKLSGRLIVFLLLPLYTSFLDQSELGTADLITTYVTLLAPVFTLELEMGVFRFLVDARDDRQRQAQILNGTYKLYAVLTVIYTALYVVAAAMFEFPYKKLVYINILIAIFWGLLLQIARGFGDNKNYAIGSLICGAVTAISNVILIKYMHYGADGVLWGTALGYLACSVYLLFTLKLLSFKKDEADKTILKEMVKYSVPLIPNHVCWWIINAADRTIVSWMLGVAANGLYSVSTKFPSGVASVFYTFQVSWQESASVHINDDDRKEFFDGVFRIVLNIFGCGCVMLIAIMPVVFPIFIKEAYHDCYKYIPVAMLGALLNCLANTYTGIYTALMKTDTIAKTSIIAAVINVVVDISLIRFVGVWAAYISTIAAYTWMLIYRWKDIKKLLDAGYDIKTLISVLAVFGAVTACYYSGNVVLEIAAFVLGTVYSLFLNRMLIKEIAENGLGFLKEKLGK